MTPHVLLIDDDPDIRLVVGAALTQVAGWRVSEAAGGAAGLEQARRDRPDVVLLDVMMPGLDGPATLAALRADEDLADLPVVMLTTNAAMVDLDGATALGAAGVLAKPFDPFSLHRQVGELLGWDVD